MYPTLISLPVFRVSFLVYLLVITVLLASYAFFLSVSRRLGIQKAWKTHIFAFLLCCVLVFVGGAIFFYGFRLPVFWVPVFSFGIFLAAALFLGFLISLLRAKRAGVLAEKIAPLCIGAIATGLLGARLMFWLSHANEIAPEEGYQIALGGLSSVGALFFGAAYLWLFSTTQKLSFPVLADILLPAIFLGVCLIRLGCFFHGCDFGAPSNSLLAVTYPARFSPEEAVVWESPVSLYQHSEDFAQNFPSQVVWLAAYDDESQGEPISLPVHPLPLYESFLGLCLFFYSVRKRPKPDSGFFVKPGRLALLLFSFYALFRFLLEMFRGDGEPRWYGFTLAQWSAVVFLFLVGGWWMLQIVRHRFFSHHQTGNKQNQT